MKPDPQHPESGFVFLKALIMTLVLGLVVTGTYRLLKNRIDVMTFFRIQQRMDILRDNLENAGRSFEAMRVSGRGKSSSDLFQCFMKKDCRPKPNWVEFGLLDALGRPMTGKFDLNGDICKSGDCPFLVTTRLKIECEDSEPSCSQPSEIITQYKIEKIENALTSRPFKPIEGEVHLSAFRCREGEYVRAITSEGYLQCAPAEISPNESRCPPGTAGLGFDSEGLLICQKIENLCKSSIALAFVVDISGSMATNNSLPFVENGVAGFIDRLKESRDLISYTSFSSAASSSLPMTPVRKGLSDVVRGQRAMGSTNLVDGLKAGAATLNGVKADEKILVLISDGFHNTGPGDPTQIANEIKASDVRILTIAVTSMADVTTLSRIASYPTDFYKTLSYDDFDNALNDFSNVLCRPK